MVAPKRKLDSITAELNEIVLAQEIDFARLDELEQDALRLGNFGFFVESKSIFGMIASIRGDYPSVKSNFEAAILETGNDPLIAESYATSLINVHHFTEALALIDSIHANDAFNLNLIELGIKAAFSSFDKLAMKKYVDLAAKLHLVDADNYQHLLAVQEEALSGIPGDISNEELRGFSDMVSQISDALVKNGFHLRNLGQSSIDGYVYIRFMIDGSIEHVIKAESFMHQYLASLPYSNFDKYFLPACLQNERLSE